MLRRVTTILTVLCIYSLVGSITAQQAAITPVPNFIRYSGTLKEAQGVGSVAPATVDVTFAIYEQQAGGVLVWQETQRVTPDTNGQYNVILGSTTATGLPDDLFSQQKRRWLGVQVQGQEEQPRVLLVSAPYAFRAPKGETLGRLAASAFPKTAPTRLSGSGPTNVETAVGASSNARPAEVPCSGLTGSGTQYSIAYFDLSTGCDLASSIISQPPSATPTIAVAGNISLSNPQLNAYQIAFPNPNSPAMNVLSLGGAIPTNLVPTDGNLFVGVGAGNNLLDAFGNTFVGDYAGANTGNCGGSVCYPANENSFYGTQAGYNNTSGHFNVFFGYQAGYMNTEGDGNTFVGHQAGYHNVGMSELEGDANSYFGLNAGYNAKGGNGNTFAGQGAGAQSSAGQQLGSNTYYGSEAGYQAVGDLNTYMGAGAGFGSTGSKNTFIGAGSGFFGQGSNNIYIGANVHPSEEHDTIRIGTTGTAQTQAFIDGTYNRITPNGVQMYINGEGRLGTSPSSRRFKEQIADMGDGTSGLMKLRPVTFFYKPEYDKGPRTLQYGLIAEDVAEVYPELVVYGNDGRPDTVRYQFLPSMLLNELQKEHKLILSQRGELQSQLQQIKAQRQEIEILKVQLQQQNASLQERLQNLESYVATQIKLASDKARPTTVWPDGNSH